MKKSNGRFKGIVIHHSKTADSGTKSWDAIKKYHIETNGWDDIGYHYGIELIDNEYKIFEGRSLEYFGAHCPPNDTIGICMVGDYDIGKQTLPEEALQILVKLTVKLLKQYNLTPDTVTRHSDHSTKTCPGSAFPWKEFKFFLEESFKRS